jgi:hypothetical protein
MTLFYSDAVPQRGVGVGLGRELGLELGVGLRFGVGLGVGVGVGVGVALGFGVGVGVGVGEEEVADVESLLSEMWTVVGCIMPFTSGMKTV